MQPCILFIPGKNPKPEPAVHEELLWRVLDACYRRTQPAMAPRPARERFMVAGWNHYYYGRHKDPTPERPWIDKLLAGNYDAAADRATANSLHVHQQRVLRSIGDRYPMLMRLVADQAISDTVREIERYFDHRRDTGRSVREILKAMLRPRLAERRPVLLIGHSLGSVIAWDTLWELTHEEAVEGKLDMLTLGSPLGMKFVQSRLLGHDCTGNARYPHLIRRWHNVAANGDLISLDPTLADDYAPMLKRGLVDCIEDHYRGVYTHYHDDRGYNPHRAYGYLASPVVATRMAEWLWRTRHG